MKKTNLLHALVIYFATTVLLYGCGGSDSNPHIEQPPKTVSQPASPINLEVVRQTVGADSYSVELTWDEVADASEYKLSYKADGEEDFTTLIVESNIAELTQLSRQNYKWFVNARNSAGRSSKKSATLQFVAGGQFKNHKIGWNEFEQTIEVMDVLALPEGGYLTLYFYEVSDDYNNEWRSILEYSDAEGESVWLQPFGELESDADSRLKLKSVTVVDSGSIVVVGEGGYKVDDQYEMQQLIMTLTRDGTLITTLRHTANEEWNRFRSDYASVTSYDNVIYVAGIGYAESSDEFSNATQMLSVLEFENIEQGSEWAAVAVGEDDTDPLPAIDDLKMEFTDELRAILTLEKDLESYSLDPCGFDTENGFIEYNNCFINYILKISQPDISEEVGDNEYIAMFNNHTMWSDTLFKLKYDYDKDAQAQENYNEENNTDGDDLAVVYGPLDEARFNYYYLEACESEDDCARHYLDATELPAPYFYKPTPYLLKNNSGQLSVLLEVYLPISAERRETERDWFQLVDYVFAEITTEGELFPLN